VYPGWVNTHHHLFQSLLKAIPAGINASLSPWLGAVPQPYGLKFDEAALRVAARVGMVELLLSGCTTICDHHYLYWPTIGYDPSAVLFDEAEKLGVRFMLARGGATRTRDFTDGKSAIIPIEPLEHYLRDVESTVQRFHQSGADAMRKVALAPTTPTFSLHAHEMRAFRELSRKLNVRLHSHLSETVHYMDFCREVHGMAPIDFVASHEWVGPDVWYAHLVHLDAREIAVLGQTGTGIAHCPQSNGRLGSGIAPVPVMSHSGMGISLGVDGAASNEAADMLNEAHAAWLLHRAAKGETAKPAVLGGRYEGGADAVRVEEIVQWGTAGGAQVLGFGDAATPAGVLQEGALADLAVYALDQPRHWGVHDPLVAPVVCGGGTQCRWVICDGKVVVDRGTVLGCDLELLAVDSAAQLKRLL
jgi:8-oxoguanine deaminase